MRQNVPFYRYRFESKNFSTFVEDIRKIKATSLLLGISDTLTGNRLIWVTNMARTFEFTSKYPKS